MQRGVGRARRGRAGLGDAHGLAAVEGLHALDLGEGDVVPRLQPMPHLVQRRYHAGVVLLGPPSDAGWEDGKWGKRRGKGRDGYQRRWLCLRDG